MATPPAGFYDDGSGRRRWWDGEQWTERYEEANAPVLTAELPAGVLWMAVGKPITGLGAGKYRLTKDILYFEKGTLSLKAQQIATHEIHDVDASQSLTQKARSVGTITLTAIRTQGRETVLLEDIPNFRDGVTQINEAAHAARDALRIKQQTQNVNYTGGAPMQPMQQQAAPAPATDLNAELGRLAQFRDQGILSEEEFSAAKRKLLGI
jgi:hypothetical protein